jgi:hypothetical protein
MLSGRKGFTHQLAAQRDVQWTGMYAARFQAFLLALGFSRFDGESRPAHQWVTRTVERHPLFYAGKGWIKSPPRLVS